VLLGQIMGCGQHEQQVLRVSGRNTDQHKASDHAAHDRGLVNIDPHQTEI
jgi:hypothetical protein